MSVSLFLPEDHGSNMIPCKPWVARERNHGDVEDRTRQLWELEIDEGIPEVNLPLVPRVLPEGTLMECACRYADGTSGPRTFQKEMIDGAEFWRRVK